MAGKKKHTILYTVLSILLIIIVSAAAFSFWLAHHYKQIISERLPQIVANSSDSIYHISFSDISVNIFKRRVTITDLRLTPDKKQAAYLRQQHRKIPPTLSTVSIPSLEAYGITWEDVVAGRSVDCKNVVVHDLEWKLECTPRPQDSLFKRDEKKKPFLNSITSAHVDFINPHITYHYRGRKDSFFCFMKGGTAMLNNWAYHTEQEKDASVFLYAKNGKVRFDSFIFYKRTGRYTIKNPTIDFEAGPNSVTIKEVKIKHMIKRDPATGIEKETYNMNFPETELVGFNWDKLINHNTLAADVVNAREPMININFLRENAGSDRGRKGKYPNQLLLQLGLQTNLKTLNIKNGHLKYVEVTKKEEEGVIEFTHIRGKFTNVTNIDSIRARKKSCVIKLEGKYKGKSKIDVTFDLSLADTTGKFKIDGYVENLDGKDVSEQAAVFTLVKVTSFHLNHMDIHIYGDETYEKGDFTVLYQDLKISLFKFDTKYREGKKGAFKFIGSALVLYPSNPMPGKEPRTVTTSFARDTTKGFIYLIWQNIFRAAKKTAVREQEIITLTDGRETEKGEQPKKGILKRLFGKKK